jgi:hypothetical protein
MEKDPLFMRYWDQCKTPPDAMLKEISGGRLAGKTDIKPQWRIQAMTEMFGPAGTGWWYEIKAQKEYPIADGQIALFVDILLFYQIEKVVSYGIPATGCSLLVEKEKSGLHLDKDAAKKALTDALGVAMTRLGVAADVYMGIHEKKQGEQKKYWQQYMSMLLQYRAQLGSAVYDQIVSPYLPLDQWVGDQARLNEIQEKLNDALVGNAHVQN